MDHPAARADFWRQSHDVAGEGTASEPWIAINPHRPEDAAGLAEFARSRDTTRSLLYFQTSGSEGVPKWVGLSRAACLASAQAVNAHLESTAADRWLIPLPLHHVGGFSILARCHASGASFHHWQDRWSPHEFASHCTGHRITLTSLVPTQLHDLVQARLEAPAHLRAIVVGGGALARETGLRALELGWPVLQSYGMTETASQVATEPLEHLRAGFDPDSLEVLPCLELATAEDGALIVRGKSLAAGYAVKRDNAWHWEPIDPTQGLRTRDRVQLWQHGTRRFLRFLGRESSFVKVLGELVSLPEMQRRLESVLQACGTDPRSAIIWPVSDPRKDTRLVLVGEGSVSALEGTRVRFNEAAAGYERLDAVFSVDALPRTALGKVDTMHLQRLIVGSRHAPDTSAQF